VTQSHPLPIRTDPVWRSVRRTLGRLGEVWELPGLPREIDVVFSERLQSRLGRATPLTGKVALHIALAGAPRALLREVLCHEAAHVAVFWRHGENRRPHGPEWAKLVREAGYEPRKTLEAALPGMSSRRVGARRYEHLCPVCQVIRVAKRPMARWRCQACVESGLSGSLEIRRLDQ
jgi:predicted SprT family Zn-dependent metalloprotease